MRSWRKKKKLTHWLLIAYSIVLIASMALVLLMNDNLTLSKAETELFGVESELLSGNYQEIDEQYKTVEYHFDYEEDTLELTSQYPENSLFILKEKQEQDQKVDVTIFGPYAQINQYDVSDQMATLQAEIQDKELAISITGRNYLDMNLVTTNFTSNQFLSEEGIGRDFAYNVPIIYIQLPPNININHGPEIHTRTVQK
ncbi:hypothetical protein [Bacillus mesophilum]|uniref:Uncharacterized protein n=1 Tax=Bacillus mesophilum TaxID=1071718 RepID=A0A7V7RIZ8_9BACI|nr:hypothetical protein [Bacillus mesophilum]KAB2330614.1 hypothetical protein F7732_18370 [Bacillus mesophilum]